MMAAAKHAVNAARMLSERRWRQWKKWRSR